MTNAAPLTRTHPAEEVWTDPGRGFRRWETSVVLGTRAEAWEWATTQVLRWGVKTRSGFSVEPAAKVARGDRPVITARPFGLAIREPGEVVDVVETSTRVGFAYRTLPGHPVSGEEAFIVHQEGGVVLLTIRSLTRPAERAGWRLLYPVLLVAQRIARRRYRRALRVRPVR